MKPKALSILPYLLILALNYYLLPLAITNTGMAMLVILVLMPLISFFCAFICGVRQGFQPLFLTCGSLLFIPVIFIYLNPSAWIYAPVYAMILILGNTIGKLLHNKR